MVNRVPAKRPRHRHGVPVLRALSAHDRLRQPRLRPAAAQRARRRDRPARARRRREARSSTPFLARKPHALSGGQRQRVALGRAIVRDPKVFLFDEPLSNLDAALRVSTRNELIKQQHELGTTTIYVTHDQVEAMTMGDRICIMNKGEVVQIGKPLEVYRNPADAFVARFLGNPPMNLLPARLGVRAIAPVARFADVAVELPGYAMPALRPYLGGAVTLGIRPEDLYETPPPAVAPRTQQIATRVLAVEPLGAETLLMLASGRLRSGDHRARRTRTPACAWAARRRSPSIRMPSISSIPRQPRPSPGPHETRRHHRLPRARHRPRPFRLRRRPGLPPAAASRRGRAKRFAARARCARREHALLVQPSCYGTGQLGDAGRRMRAPGRFKAIAVVAIDTTDKALAALAARGVVGVRFNLVNYDRDALARAAATGLLDRLKAADLAVQIYAHDAQWPALLPVLSTHGVRVIRRSFRRPRHQHGRRGVRLSGGARTGAAGKCGGEALRPLPPRAAKQLWKARRVCRKPVVRLRDRALRLGLDWPFLAVDHAISHADLPATIGRWLPDPADRRRILWTNPVRLFGFGERPA